MRHRNPLMGRAGVVIVTLVVATCTSVAQQEEWKFEDDFSSPRGGWPIGTTDRGDEFGYVDGKYRILIKIKEGQVAGGQIAGIPLAGRRFQTLAVEADTIQQIGPPAALQGLGCGTSPAELYFFLINLDGSYFIIRDDAATASDGSDLLQTGRITIQFAASANLTGSERNALGANSRPD